jgi:hypothetical protein
MAVEILSEKSISLDIPSAYLSTRQSLFHFNTASPFVPDLLVGKRRHEANLTHDVAPAFLNQYPFHFNLDDNSVRHAEGSVLFHFINTLHTDVQEF